LLPRQIEPLCNDFNIKVQVARVRIDRRGIGRAGRTPGDQSANQASQQP
jgi:hypothetical protein